MFYDKKIPFVASNLFNFYLIRILLGKRVFLQYKKLIDFGAWFFRGVVSHELEVE